MKKSLNLDIKEMTIYRENRVGIKEYLGIYIGENIAKHILIEIFGVNRKK